ncbi:thioredoxin domain-containing protein [Desulfonatronum parangueonense]
MQPGHQPNRLAKESSHYLLQHARNPVNWFAWGEEAFERARSEDKPILLSIGYSTCHWCHVMERECFEDQAVADLMNRHLISIKVDREERPDIDQVYMSACHVLGQRGGWPLTVFMGPDGRPFFIATYIPRESGFGRMGMLDLIPRVAEVWNSQRKDVLATGIQLEEALRAAQEQESMAGDPDPEQAAHQAYNFFAQRFDSDHGGFGTAPKFPSPHNLLFLLQYAREHNVPQAQAMVETTLERMRLGGLFDHVGFGFHRYSTDVKWLLPHFEKMLYDQAMLLMAYTEAWRAGGDPLCRRVVAEIIDYVVDQLATEEGGFGSGQDADSEGEEGRFYVWTRDELLAVLGPEDGEWVCRKFQIQPGGNFQEEATGKYTGANILHLDQDMTDPVEQERWAVLRIRLKMAREERPHPLTDDGVLADWNGLLMAALAKAGAVFDQQGWLETARGCAELVLTVMRDDKGRIRHRLRTVAADQPAGAPDSSHPTPASSPTRHPASQPTRYLAAQGFLEDQAFVVWGLLELYEADQNPRWLNAAEEITRAQLRDFGDEANGGFFLTARDAEPLLFRPKQAAEGALPSGNAVSAANLLRLATLTGNQDYATQAHKAAHAFGNLINTQPHACTHWLTALSYGQHPAK